ncbi:Two-component system sensor histidine kinase [hydrothermal vent metagenome]|uniref:Two-component system sensor histidine kinase n=1 Tax=hydrothermal vent metagenome TaxID=652676 RepID=A0A3B0QXS1_9ZZZZ
MNNRNFLRWIIIVASFAIISLILWNTYTFFQHFKAEERTKMQNWSYALSSLQNPLSDGSEIEVTSRIIESNTSTPMMIVDPNNEITSIRNIDTLKINNPKEYLNKLKLRFEKENTPIPLGNKDAQFGSVYYGNSPLINKLKYYPLALVLIIVLFAAVVFFFYRSSRVATQNKLWSGMAKETAHQIGTPLSSLIGWTEILKMENVNPDHIIEIEKDIDRLQTITDRFSKIGSIPTLKNTDIITETQESYNYLKARSSKLIDFEFVSPNENIHVNLNAQLYSWTIENLVKNAIDAMKGKGQLKIEVLPKDKFVHIRVSDSGKGIPKHLFKKIFDPGFTSKKRGWGLGLSLAKRIIEDYHNGRIKVVSSEIDKGTTIQISLKQL